MATNGEMLVSAFQEKVAIRSSVNLANMFSYVSQWPDYLLVNQIHGNFRSKTLCCRKMKSVFTDVKVCFNASRGHKETSCHVCWD